MIKNVTETGISRDHTLKIRIHPRATSIDMCDHIKPKLSSPAQYYHFTVWNKWYSE